MWVSLNEFCLKCVSAKAVNKLQSSFGLWIQKRMWSLNRICHIVFFDCWYALAESAAAISNCEYCILLQWSLVCRLNKRLSVGLNKRLPLFTVCKFPYTTQLSWRVLLCVSIHVGLTLLFFYWPACQAELCESCKRRRHEEEEEEDKLGVW